jgi:hypothetical protein
MELIMHGSDHAWIRQRMGGAVASWVNHNIAPRCTKWIGSRMDQISLTRVACVSPPAGAGNC